MIFILHGENISKSKQANTYIVHSACGAKKKKKKCICILIQTFRKFNLLFE